MKFSPRHHTRRHVMTMGAAVATMMFVIMLIGVMLYLFGIQRRMQRYAL